VVWTWPSVVAVDAGCYANSIEGKGEDCSVPGLCCGAWPFIAPSKEAPAWHLLQHSSSEAIWTLE
ncbi:MAG TPA: hypothetical protein VMH20_08440, partial [Verrucomicrobiae bacterium]|nr:hypothetical protein [Verrucomicrobiae bacterium]